MIKYDNKPLVKEASSIYGEFVEKKAFDASVILPALVGSLTGGITSSKLAEKGQTKNLERRKRKYFEGDHYQNLKNLIDDVQVVFTPINVIFDLSGQTIEIISVDEMNEEMRSAHRRKDGEYFVKLLVTKMNMELQMAERYFARRLLEPQLQKQASETPVILSLMNDVIADGIDATAKNTGLDQTKYKVNVDLNLDTIRPFDKNNPLFSIDKVANTKESIEALSLPDVRKRLVVTFLPDRVLFLVDNLLVDQMNVLNMNEEGFEAFKSKDKGFFRKFFLDYFKARSEAFEKTASADEENKITLHPEFKNFDFYKTAASLEEMREEENWSEILTFDKEYVNIFLDDSAHPIAYDAFFDSEYGGDWHELSVETILKDIEEKYTNNEPIADQAFNKILLLHSLHGEDTTLMMTAFAFEKFVRAMNNKQVAVDQVEGNLEFEEIIFALEIAESVSDNNIYLEMTENVATYVAEQLYEDGIRSVSKALYFDENNEFKNDFWSDVNGVLLRKWQDRDSRSLLGEESFATRELTVWINEAIDHILIRNADLLDFNKPYLSSEIVSATYFGNTLDRFEYKEGIIEVISNTITRHLLTVMFLEIKREEAEYTIEMMSSEGERGE